MYVIRDCDNVSIRSKIALFISHEVLVLDSGRKCFEITIDTIYHYLNLAYTLISTVDYKSDNVYEYFAVLRNLCGNFNHCQVAEINDKFKGVLKHFIGVQKCSAIYLNRLYVYNIRKIHNGRIDSTPKSFNIASQVFRYIDKLIVI